MSTAKEQKVKGPFLRRFWRVLRWTVGIFIVLVLVGYLVGTSGGFVKSVILPKVGAAMNADLTATEVEVSPFRHVILRGLKVQPKNGETLLTANSVTARYSLISIIKGKIDVSEVTVDTPTVTLVENADGTSNLDGLSGAKTKETPKAPAPETPSAPPNIDIKAVTIKNGTFRQTRKLANGAQELRELSNVHVGLKNIRNDFTGNLDSSAWLYLKNTGSTNAGTMNGTFSGNFTISFDKGFNLASANGKSSFTVSKVDGIFTELAGVGMTLDCDVTPTAVKQLALRFTQAGESLGEIGASGPFDPAKSEGKLNVVVRSIDRRALNIFGKPRGMDFGTTLVNSTNVVELAKGGSMIAAAGRLEASRLRVTREGQSTPTLDLRCVYDVTVDNAAGSALLKVFNLVGTQDSRPLLNGELTSPMTISLGKSAATGGDATLKLSLANVDLSDWRAFAPGMDLGGSIGASITVLAQEGGKQLTVDVNSQIAGLSAKLDGTNGVKDLSAHLQAHVVNKEQGEVLAGKLTLTGVAGSYGDYRFNKYGVAADFDVVNKGSQLEIRKASGELREGSEPGGKFDVAGQMDTEKGTGKIQVTLTDFNQNGLRPFLESMLGDKKLVSVAVNSASTVELLGGGDASVKSDTKLTNLVVNDPKGSLPTTPLELRAQLDTSVAKSVAQIRQCELTLTPTERAKNSLNLTGNVDFSKTNAITGGLKLAAESLDVTRYYDLFAAAPPAATTPPAKPAPAPAPAPPTPQKEPDAVTFPMQNFISEVDIGKFYLREIEIAAFKTTTKVDGGRVLVKPLQLTVNGAPLKTDLDLDLSVPGYRYDVSLVADAIPLAPFVNSFQPERKGQVAGTLTANAQIKGAGVTDPSIQKNLSGQFSVLTTNINLSVDNIRNPILTSVLNVIIAFPELLKNPVGVVGNWVGRLTGLGGKKDGWMDEISGAPINVIAVNGTAGNGVVKIQHSEVSSKAFMVDAAGDITLAPVLNDSKMKIPVRVSLNRSLAGKIGFVDSTTPTNATYVALPNFVSVEGTLGKSEVKTDKLAIGKIALTTGVGVGKGIGGTIGGFIKDGGKAIGIGNTPATDTNQPSATTTNKESTAGSIIRGLGGLLGGKKEKDKSTNAPTNAPAPPK